MMIVFHATTTTTTTTTTTHNNTQQQHTTMDICCGCGKFKDTGDDCECGCGHREYCKNCLTQVRVCEYCNCVFLNTTDRIHCSDCSDVSV